jgi:hypothetical protein
MAEETFKAALTKLASDPEYRQKAQEDPTIIEKDYGLSVKELQALRQVAVLSGADVSQVDHIRGTMIAERSGDELKSVDNGCCCCCCCCCGETAVLVA